MKKSFRISPPIDPRTLSAEALDELCAELYAVHNQIFEGVSPEAFRKYVIEPPTVLTRIYCCRSAAGQLVGYFTFQVYQTSYRYRGRLRRPYVFRSEMGVLPAFRGKCGFNRILFRDACRFMLARFRPWRGLPEAWFMATPINPIAYYNVCRDIAEVYPQPQRAMPTRVAIVRKELSKALDLTATESEAVKKVGWIVRMHDIDVRRMARRKNAWVQFYLRHNPGYRQGEGLMWLAPATLRNAFRSLLKGFRFRINAFPRYALPQRIQRSWQRQSSPLRRDRSAP